MGNSSRGSAKTKTKRKPPPKPQPTLVKTFQYMHDALDPIDVEMGETLKRLSIDAKNTLALSRISPGKYEIDGRPCLVDWEGKQLLVQEEKVDGAGIADMSLHQYLQLWRAHA